MFVVVVVVVAAIGHFAKYYNTLCLSPNILHKHCLQFLLELTMVPRENKNSAYAKFGGTNKEYYGIFRSGLFGTTFILTVLGDLNNYHEVDRGLLT